MAVFRKRRGVDHRAQAANFVLVPQEILLGGGKGRRKKENALEWERKGKAQPVTSTLLIGRQFLSYE